MFLSVQLNIDQDINNYYNVYQHGKFCDHSNKILGVFKMKDDIFKTYMWVYVEKYWKKMTEY